MKIFSAQALLLASFAAIAAGSCAAADEPVAKFGQLDALRSQNALLSEALKNAKLKNELLASAKPTQPSIAIAPVKSAPTESETFANMVNNSGAQVQLVSGVGSDLVAVIGLPNGGRVKAAVGRTIAGLGVVKSITLNEVLIESKKATISIPFATEQSAGNAQGLGSLPVSFPASPSMSQMPPLPPPMMPPMTPTMPTIAPRGSH